MAATSAPPGSRARKPARSPQSPQSPQSSQSSERLLHDLHVHQIELELQNEELRRAHLALEESRDRYVELYDFAPVGYVTVLANGLIRDVNLPAAALLGMERSRLRQTRFSAQVSPDDCDCWHRFFVSVMREAGKTRRSTELALVRHDGTGFHAQLDCVRMVADTQEASLHIALTDITDRKQAEAEQRAILQMEHLRQLAVEEMLTEQRERHAIATDLHDGLGQTLHVARIKLDILAKGVSADSRMIPLIEDLSGLFSEASREIRALTSKLSPPALMDLGLVPALSGLAAEMERVYGLMVTISDDGAAKPLSQPQAAILFRAARELLINVAKHAGVSAARVDIRIADGRLRLTVEDRGGGLGDGQRAVTGGMGFGLPSVRERIAFLGGSMGIKTRPGDGTTIILDIPLTAGAAP